MNYLQKITSLCSLFILCFSPLTAVEIADLDAIDGVIHAYANAWNNRAGHGFANNFTEDADFVNIYGSHFLGKNEIEFRHVQILQNFLKDSKLEILTVRLRDVQPDLVIALVKWRLRGFRNPGTSLDCPGETRDGIFTQVFINVEGQWKITSSQNTLISNTIP